MTATRYLGTQAHCALVARWYEDLYMSGEIYSTFTPDVHTIGAFYALWHHDATLYFHEEEGRIVLAWWTSPAFSGVFFGLWIAPELRRAKRALRWFEEALEFVLARSSVILGVTRQEKLLAPHLRMGYTVVGRIPGLWYGYDAWLVALTKEGFHGRRRKRRDSRADCTAVLRCVGAGISHGAEAWPAIAAACAGARRRGAQNRRGS